MAFSIFNWEGPNIVFPRGTVQTPNQPPAPNQKMGRQLEIYCPKCQRLVVTNLPATCGRQLCGSSLKCVCGHQSKIAMAPSAISAARTSADSARQG